MHTTMREVANSLVVVVACRFLYDRHTGRYLGSKRVTIWWSTSTHVLYLCQTLTYVINRPRTAWNAFCLINIMPKIVRTPKMKGKCTILGFCFYYLLSKDINFLSTDKIKLIEPGYDHPIPRPSRSRGCATGRFCALPVVCGDNVVADACCTAECSSLSVTFSPTFSSLYVDTVSTAHQLQRIVPSAIPDLVE